MLEYTTHKKAGGFAITKLVGVYPRKHRPSQAFFAIAKQIPTISRPADPSPILALSHPGHDDFLPELLALYATQPTHESWWLAVGQCCTVLPVPPTPAEVHNSSKMLLWGVLCKKVSAAIVSRGCLGTGLALIFSFSQGRLMQETSCEFIRQKLRTTPP